MPRISGTDIPNEKRSDIALTYLYGIGRSNVNGLIEKAGIDPAKRAKNLTGDEIAAITRALDGYSIEGELRKAVRDNIERLKHTGSYRGSRHGANLPVHGQRTRTNARTKRGKRMTVGALKKEDAAKLETTAKKE